MATIIKASELRDEDTRAIEDLLRDDAACHLPKVAQQVLQELVEAQRAGKLTIVAQEGALLTPKQVAHVLDISRERVDALIRRGALKSTPVGKQRRVALADVLEKQRRLEALEEMRVISYTQGFPL